MPVAQTTNQPSFDSVWAILQEVEESQKETDRIVKEVGRKQEEYAGKRRKGNAD